MPLPDRVDCEANDISQEVDIEIVEIPAEELPDFPLLMQTEYS